MQTANPSWAVVSESFVLLLLLYSGRRCDISRDARGTSSNVCPLNTQTENMFNRSKQRRSSVHDAFTLFRCWVEILHYCSGGNIALKMKQSSERRLSPCIERSVDCSCNTTEYDRNWETYKEKRTEENFNRSEFELDYV